MDRSHERSKRSRRTQLRRRSYPAWPAQRFSIIVCCCGVGTTVLLLLVATSGVFKAQQAGNTHPSTLLSETKAAKHNHDNQQQLITAGAAHNNNILVFHEVRSDRSGATIHDMLLAHAFAFQQNQTYGGACARARHHPQPAALEHLPDHLEMIAVLGLGHVLRFACPDENDKDPSASAAAGGSGGGGGEFIWIDRHLYTRFGTRIWTPEWLEHIRGQQRRVDSSSFTDNNNTMKGQEHGSRRRRRVVVAHIRRGDVDLCDPATRDRYLTNRHYRNLIDKHAGQRDEVILFSERKSTESWRDFADCCHLQLDQPPARAWRAMMDADVLILSKSSFSIVPALFNRKGGVIVYTPFWVEPLEHWTRVDSDTDRAERRAQIRLQHQLCD